jgi:hypothetical protein
MPPEGFEPAIPAGERLQTHALDRSATGIGNYLLFTYRYWCISELWNTIVCFLDDLLTQVVISDINACHYLRSLISSSVTRQFRSLFMRGDTCSDGLA